ncbi:MAG: hypothetical protein K6G07_01625 [Lachnospiraceae bacterium]|nr:hypothetical protein [Lachnospiraceae bacterium]
MLIAGAITGIFAYIRDFSLLDTILWLACAMCVFYILGYYFRWILDGFERDIREKEKEAAIEAAKLAAAEESAVIEKEVSSEDENFMNEVTSESGEEGSVADLF